MKCGKLVIMVLMASLFMIFSCKDDSGSDRDYRQDMRNFVQAISEYAKDIDPNFIVIPQNGQELITLDGEEDGEPDEDYLDAIDGVGREDLFYGYDNDDEATPADERDYMISFLDIAESYGVEALVTDYCWTASYVTNSNNWNNAKGYISFAAPSRELDTLPGSIYNSDTNSIISLSAAKNFLYLINPDVNFVSKNAFRDSIDDTDYDVLIIDLFYDDTELTPADITTLKTKKGTANTRLVIAYMSIGEAEDYRYYWDPSWDSDPPSWIEEENPDWEGNYKVQYWKSGWQEIIYGNDSSYMKKIIDAGFDGVYLDIIDAFEYFE